MASTVDSLFKESGPLSTIALPCLRSYVTFQSSIPTVLSLSFPDSSALTLGLETNLVQGSQVMVSTSFFSLSLVSSVNGTTQEVLLLEPFLLPSSPACPGEPLPVRFTHM